MPTERELAISSSGEHRMAVGDHSEFDSEPRNLEGATRGGAPYGHGFFDHPVALGVGLVPVPAGMGAEALGDAEGGLVLGELTGGVVPGSG